MKTQIKLPAAVEDFTRTVIESNLLKYSAGRAIFCNCCGDIMDWRKTVAATLHGTPKSRTDEIVVRAYVQCARCYDARKDKLAAVVEHMAVKAPECKVRLEVVDGRDERFNAVED